MATGKVEDDYIIRPDAFGRFEVYVRYGDVGVMRPRGRFSTAEAAQAWVDRRKAKGLGGIADTPLQVLLRGKRAVMNGPSRS
ncbi:MAG: hypothetical protein ACJ8AW_08770 [Rhodopila sp.]